ncbi:hypothetical protein H5410_060391 [Solanum commersonii]|uniref:Uncharacterized protein n=1 Tax=Solanum commersonii TaxID=4109 RepID=A0A9J5W5B1_SOLCO|nr:hypothetical protein H5410_060391 [Solanum commersonii]
MQGEQELGSQSNHFFFDGTNLCINQTFSNKNELQLLLAEATTKKSFDFATIKSCTKYLKNKFPAEAVVLEHDIDFKKWSRVHFRGNRYDMMTTNIAESLNVMERHAYILKSMGNQMLPAVEKITRKNYRGRLVICGEQPCAHAMTTLRSKHGNEYGMASMGTLRLCIKLKHTSLHTWILLMLSLLSRNGILPPLVDTKSRRKRRKRVKGVSENFKSKRKNKCSICKRTRHKRTTCMNNNKS